MNQIEFPLESSCREVLLGSMLGDGCVTFNGKNICYCEMHGKKQTDYLLWKAKMLSCFKPTMSFQKCKTKLTTPSHPLFIKLRNDFYGTLQKYSHKKHLPDYVDCIDYLGLLVWYLDDGNLDTGPIITSTLFQQSDLQRVLNSINSKLGLSLYMRLEKGGTRKKIYFDKQNRKKVLPIWEKLFEEYGIPNSMKYKLASRTMQIHALTKYPITFQGVTKSIGEWASNLGIKYQTLLARKRRGWSDEECVREAKNSAR